MARSDTYYYSYPAATADDAKAIADIQAAQLRFRSDGVTHVIALEVNGQVFFGRDADTRHYRPRYGVNSAGGLQGFAGNSFRSPNSTAPSASATPRSRICRRP